jgi:hypothetical protein
MNSVTESILMNQFEAISSFLITLRILFFVHSSPNIIRVIKSRRFRWAGHVARMGEERGAYRILVGRPRRRWEDNIKTDLREVGWGGHELD